MVKSVVDWADIECAFNQGLLLGNGASIAFDERFKYDSLKIEAKKKGRFTDDVEKVFNHLKTDDFEFVLKMLWHASVINQSLEISDNETQNAYENVRNALINVVRDIHVDYTIVSDRLPNAANFMALFSTVVSLNYDLLVYWALMIGNEQKNAIKFKDCFVTNSRFDFNWERLRHPLDGCPTPTLVFYPHGNLVLGADIYGMERKILASENEGLLDQIINEWDDESITPVFVSEGTSSQKVAAINRSRYLSAVYYEVLPKLGKNIVFFGWSFDDNDVHLLDAILRGYPDKIAIAIDPNDTKLAEKQANICRKISDRMGQNTFDLIFFNQYSQGCWITPTAIS